MKRRMLILAALSLALPAAAEPHPQFAPALKPAIAAVTHGALRSLPDAGIRNGAYTIEALRAAIQRDIREEQNSLALRTAHVKTAGMRERITEEAAEFLKGLSPEVDRLAKESSSAEEFASRLAGISSHVNAWANPSASAAPARARLAPTEDSIEGPFYRPNAPISNQVAPGGASGARVVISGQVLDTDGAPLVGALVDVWQADADGAYDIADPKDRNNPAIPYRFRARMRADASGRYSFGSIMPGQYEIGEGRWRPKHIHLKVSAPGTKPLTTQLYFEGDKYNAVDPWWKAATTIAAVSDGTTTGLKGTFDIVLAKKP